MPAGVPPPEVRVPRAVRAVLGDRAAKPVWRNELGGLTFEVTGGTERVFVTWVPAGSGLDLAAEAERSVWAAVWAAAPRVLDRGEDEEGSWLVTAALPGRSAVDERWLAQPDHAAAGIGEGLQALHEALPVARCPFTWSAPARVADARRRFEEGLFDPDRWARSRPELTVAEALDLVADPPPIDRLVVCHGDACAPNTLLDDAGACSGHVDLGGLGVADRWADLAVATLSLGWNYGPGWEPALLAAYGVDADPVRTRYYRLLWDLGP